MAHLMKGFPFQQYQNKVQYPVIAEVKEDEVRCRIYLNSQGLVQFQSYAGKPLYNLAVFAPKFLTVLDLTGYNELDVGILVNRNFNDSYRWVRSSRGIPSDLNPYMVEFLLFDLPELDRIGYADRRDRVHRLTWPLLDHGLRVRQPLAQQANSEAELSLLFEKARADGKEGLMVKDPDHLYVRKRSRAWLKMKPEDTADGKIVRVNRAVSIEGKPLDRAGSVDVELEDGSVASPAGIAHALGELMWAFPNHYIGQWVEFKYMERDRDGGYRHPSLVRFREAKQ